MLFIKIYNCQKPQGLTLFFIIADTTCDLLIMHACDTFCDELILAITYVISIHCNYFTVNIPRNVPVFMKYAPVQNLRPSCTVACS